jgi:hypothetical protein
MSNQFTKYEAIKYLGEMVQFKKRWSRKSQDDDPNYDGFELDFIEAGELARVDYVEDTNGLIQLTLVAVRDDDLRSFDKSNFEQYCVLLKPESKLHARSL